MDGVVRAILRHVGFRRRIIARVEGHNPAAPINIPNPINGANDVRRPIDVPTFEASADRMTIADAQKFVDGLVDGTEEKELAARILEHRKDPRRHFAPLVDEPEVLLELMRMTKTIHSGSRAAEYFVPGSCHENSDWDFYCLKEISPIVKFHLGEMGVQWEAPAPRRRAGLLLDDDEEDSMAEYSVMGFDVRRGFIRRPNRTYEVQLISAKSGIPPSSAILKFHTSISQNIISGFAAVSLYDEYTSNRETIHWTANDTNCTTTLQRRAFISRHTYQVVNAFSPAAAIKILRPNPLANPNTIVRKYLERGFNITPFGSRGSNAHGNAPLIGQYGVRARNMGDSGARIISFGPYVSHEHWEHPLALYLRAMESITWYEWKSGTIAVPSPLNVIEFPYDRQTDIPGDEHWGGSNHIFDPIDNHFALTYALVDAVIEAARLEANANGPGPDENRPQDWLDVRGSKFVYASRLPF